jgi:hemin uptake protein HemP
MGEYSKTDHRSAERLAVTVAPRRRLQSATLLGTAREAIIEHEGVEYVLRITSQNKLILTK